MGWIHTRHMRRGGSIGGRRSSRTYPKDGAPLRKIVEILRYADGMFDTSRVKLECGHEAESWGGVRARCPGCKPAPPEEPGS